MEISLCMIVKDEEACLERCLESVKEAVDEIVIVDTGSADRTVEIARRFTPKVYSYVWKDDFAHARNTAFSYATKPYLMWMDADDVLEQDGEEKLIGMKSALDGHIDAVMMPYACGMRSDGKPLLVFDRERIVRAGAGFRFEGAVHEAMAVSGCVVREDIVIWHKGEHSERSNRRNIGIYEKWIKSGQEMAARDRYYYARELMTAGQYEKAEKEFRQVIAMKCWKENRIDAHLQRAKCLMRLERLGEARAELYSAIAVDAPRAQALCALGALEMQAGRDEAAVFWYRAARLSGGEAVCGAFEQADCRDYIPAMQLCVLLDRMGRMQEAAAENERALIARPGDRAALENRAYFQRKTSEYEPAAQAEKRAERLGRAE